MTRPGSGRTPERLTSDRLAEVVAVHCDAFRDYPTLRFVLGDGTEPYPDRLEVLIEFFLATTVLRGGVVFGLEDDGGLVAAADLVVAGTPEPPELDERRQALWQRLGAAARERYVTYSQVAQGLAPEAPHHYLSMLGVRRRAAGRGLARPLVEAVITASAADAGSSGVALETEDARNVSLYEHFGFELLGHARVTKDLECWGFFRPHD